MKQMHDKMVQINQSSTVSSYYYRTATVIDTSACFYDCAQKLCFFSHKAEIN